MALTDQRLSLAIGQAKTFTATMDAAPEGGAGSWDMRFRIRSADGTVLVTKTSADGITCTDAVNGVWTIALTAADTADLGYGVPTWSFWDRSSGQENPLAKGTIEIFATADAP